MTFELSKVETKAIRDRMLGQLVNVDPTLAQRVASGLGHRGAIARVAPATTTRTNLKPSPALSLLAKAQPTLQGRMIGCLVADGSDAGQVKRSESCSEGCRCRLQGDRADGRRSPRCQRRL